ncbi:MAG: 4Fe-4S binding protein [Eubacteriaceae bacterium]
MKKSFNFRPVVQLFFFLFVFAVTISKWLVSMNIVVPILSKINLHAICPFGGVETIYKFLTTGALIQKIHNSSVILMILSLLVALLFGAIFCGYICPFGTFQEWIGKLGKKLFPQKFNQLIPKKIDSILRYGRYIVLAIILYYTAIIGKLVFQDWDPYYALFNFFTGEVAITSFIILGIFIALSLIIERPWCKYFCPYGAILGLFNIFRIFQLKRNKATCIDCKRCDKVCPMNLDISTKTVVRNHQCISCYQCTSDESCPKEATLEIKLVGGNNHEA